MPRQLKLGFAIATLTSLVLIYQNCAVYKNDDRKELEGTGYETATTAAAVAKLRSTDCQTLLDDEHATQIFGGPVETHITHAQNNLPEQTTCFITPRALNISPVLCTITYNEALSVSCETLFEADQSLAGKNSHAEFIITLTNTITERLDQ